MILSIETATSTCSVAITKENKVIAEQSYFLDKSHSALMPIIIDELLGHCGIQKNELSAVAVSDGPGSYTGLRIGASVAKGICYALDIPLIKIDTIRSMAFEIRNELLQDYLFCPMLDARRMEVYMAVYDYNLHAVKSVAAVVLDEHTFDQYSDQKLILFGNGAEKTKDLYRDFSNVTYLDNLALSARNIGLMASEKLVSENFEDIAYYEPNYFKEFKAIKPKPLF